MKGLVLLGFLSAAVLAQPTSYDGYKVYTVIPKSEREMKILKFFDQTTNFDFWSRSPNEGLPATIMVAPEVQEVFTNVLNWTGIEYKILIDNVQRTLLEENLRQSTAPKLEKGRISFTQYHRYDDIQDYLFQLAESYPQTVSLEEIGVSTQGRPITLIKIGTGRSDNPIIFFESGIHAREWIAPAFALYVVEQLVENIENRQLIENVNWYIIPLLNPDGYEFSHGSILNRLWRKTRSPGSLLCTGADGNRNFDYQWMTVGASSSQCSDTFAGSVPFSEPECAALSKVILKYKESIEVFLSIHSFGQLLLYPWGWTSSPADNQDELRSLGNAVGNAIASVYGSAYTVGSPGSVLYAAAGTSLDWVAGVAGVGLSYVFELPGGGLTGFDLPAARIQAVGEETWEGIKVFYDYVARNVTRRN